MHATAALQSEEALSLWMRVRRFVLGAPRDLSDKKLFHRLALIPFLAWIGLGADGLSSSSYGPQEAFQTLGEHTYLAIALAITMAVTVILISAAYNRIIEQFPYGGGGYMVATKLLGARAGAVSGCALVIDYALTITMSLAAAGDALFSLLPMHWQAWKLPIEIFLIIGLTTLNIRGVKESVLVLAPMFFLFLITHAVLIFTSVFNAAPTIPATIGQVAETSRHGMTSLGLGGVLLLFVHAYSLGGGTYTGIEAVSNSLSLIREPRVANAQRTMVYMATSLAFTAAGLLLCYLFLKIEPVPGKTMNAVLIERLAAGWPGGWAFVTASLVSEGVLLIVAAQAGFMGGPRVLANMAVDSWMPHRFAALSDRLTTQNGILLMGGVSLAALLYTYGNVRHIVVMYSINVFLTFSLAMFGMAREWWRPKSSRRGRQHWRRRFALFASSFVLCATILTVTIFEKFTHGGWVTLVVTGALVALCFTVRAHYRTVGKKLELLYSQLGNLPEKASAVAPQEIDASKPTAVVLVGHWGGLGIHTVLNIFRAFPKHFQNLVFVSVGVIDSGSFKGEDEIEDLRAQTIRDLERYVRFAHGLGIPATYRYRIGTDAIEEGGNLCLDTRNDFPFSVFFAGKIVFQREQWYQRFLHNETAFAIQKRLSWAGATMVILPARIVE